MKCKYPPYCLYLFRIRELSELHKASAVNRSVAHEALLSAEQTARQELTEVLEKQRVEAHREKEKLLLEVYGNTLVLFSVKKAGISKLVLKSTKPPTLDPICVALGGCVNDHWLV